jgi:hypothetical protein
VEAGIDPMSVGLVGGTGDPNRPTMSDIAGLGDLGNPTGDPRVVSEEMGMVGGFDQLQADQLWQTLLVI